MAKSITVFALLACIVSSTFAGNFTVRDGAYFAEWQIVGEDLVVFVEAQTPGWVGFGLSTTADMTGADLFIGGVNTTGGGASYGADYHGLGNRYPALDAQQDVTLLVASETATSTILHFKRPLVSTDTTEDLAITGEPLYALYAWGPDDAIIYHSDNRGAVLINPNE